MTDRYARLRDALKSVPTPGPYEIYQDGGRFYVETTTRQSRCGVFKALGSPESERRANAKLAAACDPDTIRALLDERDALRRALSRILENEASDYKAAEEFGGYVLDDELREEACAALAQSEYHGRNPKSGEE